jgi:hypothetical protein
LLKDDRRRDPDNPDIKSRFMAIDKDLAAFWKEHRAVLGGGMGSETAVVPKRGHG